MLRNHNTFRKSSGGRLSISRRKKIDNGEIRVPGDSGSTRYLKIKLFRDHLPQRNFECAGLQLQCYSAASISPRIKKTSSFSLRTTPSNFTELLNYLVLGLAVRRPDIVGHHPFKVSRGQFRGILTALCDVSF